MVVFAYFTSVPSTRNGEPTLTWRHAFYRGPDPTAQRWGRGYGFFDSIFPARYINIVYGGYYTVDLTIRMSTNRKAVVVIRAKVEFFFSFNYPNKYDTVVASFGVGFRELHLNYRLLTKTKSFSTTLEQNGFCRVNEIIFRQSKNGRFRKSIRKNRNWGENVGKAYENSNSGDFPPRKKPPSFGTTATTLAEVVDVE